MANRKIRAELEIDGKDKTSPAFRSVAARMGQMEKQFAAFNRTAAQYGRQMKQIERASTTMARVQNNAAFAMNRMGGYLKASIAAYGAYAVTSGIKNAITSSAELERHMTRIGITAEASGAEVKAATDEIKNLSQEMAYSSFEPAIKALDTLTASGMDMKTALAFLPSVMRTAQASGAETEDIANAGLKTASAFKLTANDMQQAFDDMAYSGKQGQFELKDMATYIPSLSSSFAALGYKGEDGLKRLLAILQTIRMQTGTAQEAATDAQNVFGKMMSNETIRNFKKFGIDLNSELKKAQKNGEDLTEAFVRLAKQAVHGDLSKLPQLFNDQQVRLGMLALINGTTEWRKQLEALNSEHVAGTVFRDLSTVLGDTQSKLDRLSNSWEKFMTSLGSAASGPIGGAMDAVSGDLDRGTAIRNALAAQGITGWSAEKWMFMNMPLGPWSDGLKVNRMAYQGGDRNPAFVRHYLSQEYGAAGYRPSKGSSAPGAPVDIIGGVPVPSSRPSAPGTMDDAAAYYYSHPDLGPVPVHGFRQRVSPNVGGVGAARSYGATQRFSTVSPNRPDGSLNAFAGFEENVINKLQKSGEDAGQAFSDKATEKLKSDASSAGQSFGEAAAAAIRSALSGLSNIGQPSTGSSISRYNHGVNADTGHSTPDPRPVNYGHR